MRLDLSGTEQALVARWRAVTADLTSAAKSEWTRQGWIPRSLIDAAPALALAPAPGQAGTPDAGDAIAIMESARLHECAPEVMAAAMLRRFLEAPPGPGSSSPADPGPTPPRLIVSWWTDTGTDTGTGTVLAGDGAADRAWLVAPDSGAGPGGARVVEAHIAPAAGRSGPGGYVVGRDHPPCPLAIPGGTAPAVVRRLDAAQFAAFRDLTRIAGACVLAGLIDTIFDAIVTAARDKASASGDRWAAQADKHGAVDIAIRRDTAWLHLCRAIDSFGDPGGRAMFAALALAEAAAGLGDAVASRRAIAQRSGDHDALAAAGLAAAQRDLWLDLAGGTSALASTVSLVQLGPPAISGRVTAGG